MTEEFEVDDDLCELARHPIFIDGKVPCHACGWSVKAVLVDGLWVYAPHQPDGTPIAPKNASTAENTTIFICPVCEAVIEGDNPCPNGPHNASFETSS